MKTPNHTALKHEKRDKSNSDSKHTRVLDFVRSGSVKCKISYHSKNICNKPSTLSPQIINTDNHLSKNSESKDNVNSAVPRHDSSLMTIGKHSNDRKNKQDDEDGHINKNNEKSINKIRHLTPFKILGEQNLPQHAEVYRKHGFQSVKEKNQRVPKQLHSVPAKNVNQIVGHVHENQETCKIDVHDVSFLWNLSDNQIIPHCESVSRSSQNFHILSRHNRTLVRFNL